LQRTNDDGRFVDDLLDRAPMAPLAQQSRGAEKQVDSVDAAVDCMESVVEGAAGVGQDASIEGKAGEGSQIVLALGRCDRRCGFDIVDPELIQGPSDGDLLVGRETRAGELFAFAEG